MTRSPDPLRAVVTAGGTSEPVDDVRVVTNLSTGRFGAAIANALAEAGVEVTLLAGRALASHPEWVDARVRVVRFGSFAELDAALGRACSPAPDLLFMAAAVSDYSPVPADGKIRSDQDELVIVMKRNPKLLSTLRERCGVGTFLVGFKLLSGVSVDELVRTARRQVAKDRLNLCVANDLQELEGPEHPVWLVTPEGGALRRTGTKAEVARELVGFALKRHRVRWHRSERRGEAPAPDEGHAGAAALLGFAIDAGLLPGVDGNVSHRCGSGSGSGSGLWITPRQVPKASLGAADLVHAELAAGRTGAGAVNEPVAGVVAWRGPQESFGGAVGATTPPGGAGSSFGSPASETSTASSTGATGATGAMGDRPRRPPKPSIDAAVHAWLYRELAGLQGLVHFHEAVVLPTATTSFPWPCGTIEEAEEIGRALVASRSWDGGGFAVELVDHGYLLGVTDARALADSWSAARDGYRAHLVEIGVDPALPALGPILDGPRVVGVSARFDGAGTPAWSSWLLPEHRRGGRGDRVTERMDQLGRSALVGDACEVLEWYRERGWHERARQGPFVLLDPPSRRTLWTPAASVCLLDRARRRVLIGQRRTGLWPGYWAFPGGRRDDADPSLLHTALRELREETGIEVRWTEVLRERTVYVGDFAVTNFVVPVLAPAEPAASAELDARWVDLDQVDALRPMAAGTRKVVRGLADL